MPDAIIETHGLDPQHVKGEGEQLAAFVTSAWALALELKEKSGRSELGRQSAILATKLEEIRALVTYWNIREVRIEEVSDAKG